MSGRRYRAALLFTFTVMALAGCSLVEQVIAIEQREHRKEAVKPSGTPSRSVSVASASSSGALKCSQGGAGGPGCSEKRVISKTYSARYDSGPVLKPIKKIPENKSAEVREDSAFVSAVKSWIKTGMQLPGWIGPE